MSVFEFFPTDALNMHTVAYEIVLFLFFDIQSATLQEKEKELYYFVNCSEIITLRQIIFYSFKFSDTLFWCT